MAIFKGFIAALSSKSGKSAKGRAWTAYSAKMEKEDGTEYDKWISFGFEEPDVKKGDYVKITTETKGDYENVVEIKKLKNPPARQGGKAAGGNPNVNTTQQSIHYQNSRNLAATVLGILNEQNALPLTKAKDKSGEVKRYEEIMALLDKLTVRFFYDAETLRILGTVKDEGLPPEADGDLPEDDDGEDADDEDGDDEEGDDEEDEDDDE